MNEFLKHLADPLPGFECYASGDPNESLDFKTKVHHRLGKPASEKAIQKLEKTLGAGCGEVKQFYSTHDGVDIYVQARDEGISLFSVDQWDREKSRWKEGLSGLEEDELFDFQKGGTAIGEIRMSGNYIVWHEGKIYYDDHDGGDDTPLSETFFGLLDRIKSDPAKFLMDVGCYTRYCDGKTKKQWIPARYIPNMI